MQRLMKLIALLPLGALFLVSADAQDTVMVTDAELSVSFGVAEGRLVAVADQFLFVDGDHPDRSFALRKSNISQSSVERDVLSIRTHEPVNDTTEFMFRIDSPAGIRIVTAWLGNSESRTAANTFAGSRPDEIASEDNLIGEYRVAHNHFLGSCEGILRITYVGIDFQSVSNAAHSRRWDMSDIKELGHSDSDELRIAPISGSEYDFEFVGERLISDEEFRLLSDRITGLRLNR